MAEPSSFEPAPSRFPQDPSEFDADPRISFSKLDNKFILEADDGQEFEYDDALKRWIPSVDDRLLEQQRVAYAVQGVDESEPAGPKKKRKQEYTNGEDNEAKKPKKAEKPPRERKNTAVYVTNLPTNVDVDEVQSVFSRCGVIAEEIDTRAPRIKLYTDEKTGAPKGDALIVYFRAESVDLAIQMLDDTDFRLGQSVSEGKMRVAAADFSYKQQKEAPQGGSKAGGKDKQKVIKKTQKMNNKLADWDDDDPSAMPETSSRWDKVVILKHMFTLEELEEDAAAILDIKEDIRDECSKLGVVTNVVLFDKEAEGVASVRFVDDIAARECVRVMNGRFFGGQQLIAHIANGNEKFKRSSERAEPTAPGEEDASDDGTGESKRLDEFGAWLEGDPTGKG